MLIVVPLLLGGMTHATVQGVFATTRNIDGEVRHATNLAPEGVVLVTTISGFAPPVAADPATGKVYWVSGTKIQRGDYNGTNIEDLVTGLSTVLTLALDLVNGKMYWIDAEAGRIQRANLNGTLTETLISGLPTSGPPFGYALQGLALDVPNGKMYWTDTSTNTIQRANLSGTFMESVTPASFVATPVSIAVDSTDGRMYWFNLDTNSIARAATNGSNPEEILTTTGPAFGITLDTAKGKIYWGDNTSIRRANLNGTTRERAASSTTGDMIFSVFIDSANQILYYADITSGQINRTVLPRFDVVATGVYGPLDVELLYSATQTVEKVYWSAWDYDAMAPYTGVIACANPDGSGRQNLFTGLTSVTGIAVDNVSRKLYWADPFEQTIYSANLDGTGQAPVVSGSAVGFTADLEVDHAMGRLYWTDMMAGAVRRVDLSGLNLNTILTGLGTPQGLAVDSVGGRLYWTEDNGNLVQRANIDGSNLMVVVFCSSSPASVELDQADGMLYWTQSGTLYRKNLSSSAEEQLIGGVFNCSFIALNTGVQGGEGEGEGSTEGQSDLSVTILGSSLVSKNAGDTHVFEVVVAGAIGAVTYQWEKQDQASVFQPLPDGNNAWYLFPSLILEDSGLYRCSVTDAVGSAPSNTVELAVAAEVPAIGLLGLTGVAALLVLLAGVLLRPRLQRANSPQ
jgi:low density lipoprotein receptor-related protein 5/6